MDSLFTEQLYKCDVCGQEFPRDEVIKIEYGDEEYITCRKCFKELLEG